MLVGSKRRDTTHLRHRALISAGFYQVATLGSTILLATPLRGTREPDRRDMANEVLRARAEWQQLVGTVDRAK